MLRLTIRQVLIGHPLAPLQLYRRCPPPCSFLSTLPNVLSQQPWTDFAGFLAVSAGPRGQGGLIPVCPNTGERCVFFNLFSTADGERSGNLSSHPPLHPYPHPYKCNALEVTQDLEAFSWIVGPQKITASDEERPLLHTESQNIR